MSKVAVFSDVHGNRPALETFISKIKDIGATTSVFLGDAIGYIPDPTVLSLLLSIETLEFCVLGNHEQAYFENKSVPSVYKNCYSIAMSEVPGIVKDKIGNWPTMVSQSFDENKCLFVHGTIENPTTGYCYPDSEIHESEFDFVFMGNTHRPFVRRAGSTTYVNVGSIGLPRDDGRFASFGVFDPEQSTVEIHRFSIENSNIELIKRFPDITDEVKSVFNRRDWSVESGIVARRNV
jgi:predicted phosphodiesterase